MKPTFDSKITLDDFPQEGARFSDRFTQNYATMVQQLSSALQGGISLGDNVNGTVITLKLSHGVPYLLPSPLVHQATPLGVFAINCDTQAIPQLQLSTTATINGSSTKAPSGYLFVTAYYPFANITDWVSYTPTGSWVANTTYTGRWRRVGDTMEVQVHMALGGAPSGSLTLVAIPSAFAIDGTKLMPATNRGSVGTGTLASAGLGNYFLNCLCQTTAGIRPVPQTITGYNGAGAGANTGLGDIGITATVPGTFANGDSLDMKFAVPIVGWSSFPSAANVTMFMVGA